jgi:hypothetical protein
MPRCQARRSQALADAQGSGAGGRTGRQRCVEQCGGRDGKAANACSQAELDQTDADYLHGASREPSAVRAPRVNGVPVDQSATSPPLRVRR